MKRPILIAAVLVTLMDTSIGSRELESLASATEWINSAPLTAPRLQGRIVLVQFWTYSCVNWIRTLPYVREWARKYQNDGLVVIGVHAPEFDFEREPANARWGAEHFGLRYPVAVDNDFAVWRAFENQYWPALYLLDAKGRVRYRHFGEGGYEQSERMIQKLLAEAGARGLDDGLAAVTPRGVEVPADWADLRSPETYLGADRAEGRRSSGARLRLNEWALEGHWSLDRQAAVLEQPNGRISYRFHARDLNLVMTPGEPGTPVRFRVLIDGQPPGASHGDDVDQDGNGTLTEPRMYQLVRQAGAIGDRLFEIQFFDPGAAAFVFTFGWH